MLREVDVLWVVQVCIRGVEDGVDHPRLQVQEDCTGDVVFIVSLWSLMSFISWSKFIVCKMLCSVCCAVMFL